MEHRICISSQGSSQVWAVPGLTAQVWLFSLPPPLLFAVVLVERKKQGKEEYLSYCTW